MEWKKKQKEKQTYITWPLNTMVTINNLKESTYDDDTYMIAQILKAKKGNWRRFPKGGDRGRGAVRSALHATVRGRECRLNHCKEKTSQTYSR